METKTGLRYIEEELLKMNDTALEEEKDNVKQQYDYFQDKLHHAETSVPFPDVKEDDKPVDYDDAYDLNRKKEKNRENLEEQQKYRIYCSTGKLCCGHIKRNDSDFFFTDVKGLKTVNLTDDKQMRMLVNVDDRRYQDVLIDWRHPDENKDVDFSRNIVTRNKEVTDVDVVLDRTGDATIDVTDSFLKRALIRNKNNSSITSIIQTIQQKQDEIRRIPANASFIVQGCAGSGKTMVLLHRLRYLLFNQDIETNEYVMLVPSNDFKEFIKDITEEFGIYHRNIMSYIDYYQYFLGETSKHEEKNELSLPEEMMDAVYSKDFVKECYKNAIEDIREQNQNLLDYIEQCLSGKLDEYTDNLCNEIKGTEVQALDKINGMIASFSSYMKMRQVDSLNQITELRAEIKQIIKSYEKVEEKKASIHLQPVSEEDERIIYNVNFQNLQNELTKEQNAYAKATIFSRGMHKKKVSQLTIQLDSLKKNLMKQLEEEDYKKAFDGIEELPIFSAVSYEDLDATYNNIGNIYAEANKTIRADKTKLTNIENEHIPLFMTKASNNFNDLYEMQVMFDAVKDEYVEKVIPMSTYLPEYIKRCSVCVNNINTSLLSDSEVLQEKSIAPIFTLSKEESVQNQFNKMMMNEANKLITERYSSVMDDSYKYYWYMKLYFTYLSNEVKGRFPHYIYIDESQDLSASEIELIHLIHTKYNDLGEIEYPVMNLFGDVNQTITDHGIKNWNEIPFITSVFRLDENFRNTNQIVDYCNHSLSMNMTKVGVDMKEVVEYNDINSFLEDADVNQVFIVKDDKHKKELEALLSENDIDNEVYTVKSVKGLEFKDVAVFKKDMTRSERYIAYTRALSDLTVVNQI